MLRSSRFDQQGFSLVEVLCAMAIASIALVSLFRGLGQSQSAALYMEAHLGARILAQSILEDERMAPTTEIGKRIGESGNYAWQLDVEPVVINGVGTLPSSHRLYRLVADVKWSPRGALRLETLKLGK
jgi:prepilin-type N-terminal cleavage/methylation domain-containing protein